MKKITVKAVVLLVVIALVLTVLPRIMHERQICRKYDGFMGMKFEVRQGVCVALTSEGPKAPGDLEWEDFYE